MTPPPLNDPLPSLWMGLDLPGISFLSSANCFSATPGNLPLPLHLHSSSLDWLVAFLLRLDEHKAGVALFQVG